MSANALRRLMSLALLALVWAATAYLLLLPLSRSREARGNYLGGNYHLQELYVGLPLALIAVGLTIALLAPARWRKPIGFRIAALLLGILLPLGAFDMGYSLLYLGALKPIYWLDLQHISRHENVPDDELGFRRKPNITWSGGGTEIEARYEYRTDQNGFRNEPGIEQAELVFVGDSYTEAAQVSEDESYVQLAARAAGMSVINLGRGAYGPQQELIVMRRHAFQYRPKVVIWQLFEGNDLADAQEYVIWRENPDRVIRSLTERYMQNSFFQPFFAATVASKNRVSARFRHADGTTTSMRLRYRWMPDQTVERESGFHEAITALRAGKALCDENGVTLAVLFIPTQIRVNAQRFEFDDEASRRRYLPEPSGEPTENDFGTRLSEVCAELGIDYLDLFPVFRERSLVDPAGIYIPEDEHLFVEGHKIAAGVIAEWLKRRQ